MLDPARIMQRCDALARHTEQAGGLTRVFLSDEQKEANAQVLGWMREAGMTAQVDAIGNVAGRFEGTKPGAPCLMMGSHLDTVRDAGRFDGMLGVVTAIECVHALHAAGRRLPFAIEVLGFGDEEGVRFGTTLLGSRAVAGTFDAAVLQAKDARGVTMERALFDFGLAPEMISAVARRKGDVLAYAELHIEQGPVLEAEGLAVGVVTAINGYTRLAVTLTGEAGHAGTVPMKLRRDALAGAAECALAVERIASDGAELVGTVGKIEAIPGAINVIPGEVRFTVDLRAPSDDARMKALERVRREFARLADARKLQPQIQELQSMSVSRCADRLMAQMDAAVAAEGIPVRRLPSGAGHDGMAMKDLADICMLFVRCKGGISHNPAESITAADAATGAKVLMRFIENFRAAG